jgi:hypothetical protein
MGRPPDPLDALWAWSITSARVGVARLASSTALRLDQQATLPITRLAQGRQRAVIAESCQINLKGAKRRLRPAAGSADWPTEALNHSHEHHHLRLDH